MNKFYCVLKYYEDGYVEFLYQCSSYSSSLEHQNEQNSKLFESDRYSYQAKTFDDYKDMQDYVETYNDKNEIRL